MIYAVKDGVAMTIVDSQSMRAVNSNVLEPRKVAIV